ncbi:MAG: lipid-binding SYLF domain-containing protein [Candidatus Eisenbacteria bacterium]|uniref:Lipid-binding SYLF domain-containing protein n=1 Tax=Eiseniibacteriota bacterium TaxID=2212470 RepID=A0A7Y2H1C9_UNCEI|nr:lipid-binding SYLF domain-containing protein [Candidatus Eisenbacteria bacterium]
MQLKKSWFRNAFTGAITLAMVPGTVLADGKSEISDEVERTQKAAEVLHTMTQSEDSNIPEYLLEKAEGIAIIPNVVKGALLVGGRYGKGIVSQRLDNGEWSSPVFVGIGGASYGFQAGVKSTDLVLIFTSKDGLEGLLEDNLELGGEIGVAVGPIGRKASLATNLTVDSPILSYSRSEGLFAGASLEGAVLSLDHGANEDVYGKGFNAEHVLTGKVMAPEALSLVVAELDVHADSGR